ncbi:Laccase-11 [Acorus calamus]|uniref:Laccase-11 n=1 Tax=Acorus calamus TaxID=4465 RepID=A0AAV9EP58_ACOCL|nr:Laccase-11 [Acorus calamus]
MDVPIAVDNKTAMAILQYKGVPNTVVPISPELPPRNNTKLVTSYTEKLRSLNTAEFPTNVPLTVDRKLFYTIGLGQNACLTCLNGTKLTASLNNISFVMSKIGLPQAHYYKIKGVFTTDSRTGLRRRSTTRGDEVEQGGIQFDGGARVARHQPIKRGATPIPSRLQLLRGWDGGVWFMHCHLELHMMWGLKMAFVVENGKCPNEFVLPPPTDLSRC